MTHLTLEAVCPLQRRCPLQPAEPCSPAAPACVCAFALAHTHTAHRCTGCAAATGTGCTQPRHRTPAQPAHVPHTPVVGVVGCWSVRTVGVVGCWLLELLVSQNCWVLAAGAECQFGRQEQRVLPWLCQLCLLEQTIQSPASQPVSHEQTNRYKPHLHRKVVADVLHRAVLAHALQTEEWVGAGGVGRGHRHVHVSETAAPRRPGACPANQARKARWHVSARPAGSRGQPWPQAALNNHKQQASEREPRCKLPCLP